MASESESEASSYQSYGACERREKDECWEMESIKDRESQAESLEQPETITKWRPIFLTGIIFLLVGIENALTNISEYPYMHTIDPDATYAFFSIATSIANWGHVVFSVFFSLWNYRFQTVKMPLIAGRILATVGSVLYICVEVFPTNRRFVMLTCYIIFSISASSAVVLRAYIVFHSSEQDRSRACAVLSLANVFTFIVGPLIQLAFSGIEYPGKKIVKGIYFNLFSAPIWVATAVNLVTLLLIIFALPEMPREERKENPKLSWKYVRERWNKIRALDVPWILVGVVLFERVAVALSLTTMGNVISPMMISVWGMTNRQIVTWVSAGMGTVGVLAILTAIIFMATPLSRKVSSRSVLLFSMCVAIIMYVVAFPYPFSSQEIPTYNETAGTGCDPKEYKWCDSARAVNVWVFMVVVLLAMGFALPTANISLDSIYSKIVGEANQSLMQGLVVVVDDIVNVGGPLYVGETFTKGGPMIFWIVNGCITIVGALVWVVTFRWMANY